MIASPCADDCKPLHIRLPRGGKEQGHDLARAADPTPFADESPMSEQVGPHVERVEATHVALGVDAAKMHGAHAVSLGRTAPLKNGFTVQAYHSHPRGVVMFSRFSSRAMARKLLPCACHVAMRSMTCCAGLRWGHRGIRSKSYAKEGWPKNPCKAAIIDH